MIVAFLELKIEEDEHQLAKLINYGDPEYEYHRNDEYPLWKSLRQVNKAFNSFATPRVFRTILLHQHAESWERLNDIANTEHLAPLVRRIQIAHIGYLKQCQTIRDWLHTGDPFLNEQYPPAGGPMARLLRLGLRDDLENQYDLEFQDNVKGEDDLESEDDLDSQDESESQDDLDSRDDEERQRDSECYERYVWWLEGEATMRKHEKKGTAPWLDLQLLINLETIETVGREELSVIKRMPIRGKFGTDLRTPDIRRHVETCVCDEKTSNTIWYYSSPEVKLDVPLTHLPLMIFALNMSSRHLKHLKLSRYDELFRSSETDKTSKFIVLESLDHLEIDSTKGIYYREKPVAFRQVAPWYVFLKPLFPFLGLRKSFETCNGKGLCIRMSCNPPLPGMQMLTS